MHVRTTRLFQAKSELASIPRQHVTKCLDYVSTVHRCTVAMVRCCMFAERAQDQPLPPLFADRFFDFQCVDTHASPVRQWHFPRESYRQTNANISCRRVVWTSESSNTAKRSCQESSTIPRALPIEYSSECLTVRGFRATTSQRKRMLRRSTRWKQCVHMSTAVEHARSKRFPA